MEIKFLKEYDFKRFFEEIRKKYKSYGEVCGNISLKKITKDEVRAFEELAKYYKEGQNIKFRIKDLELFFEESKYGKQNLNEILFDYYGKKIKSIKDKKRIELENKKLYFDGILEKNRGKQVESFYKALFLEKQSAYITINNRYKENEFELKKELALLAKALNNLPEKSGKLKKLALFSEEISGDPHYFDETGKHFILLYEGIKFIYGLVDETNKIEERSKILYCAGLLKEGVLNTVAICGFKGIKIDNSRSKIFEAVNEEREYLILTLDNLRGLESIEATSKKIYMVENPSVFSYIFEKIKDSGRKIPSIICTSGQLNLTAYQFLEKLKKEGKEIYYSGDLDPEGMLIACNIKKKYDNVKLWGYNIKNYMENLSGKTITDLSLSKLNNIDSNDLKELVAAMRDKKEAVYQEKFLMALFDEVC